MTEKTDLQIGVLAYHYFDGTKIPNGEAMPLWKMDLDHQNPTTETGPTAPCTHDTMRVSASFAVRAALPAAFLPTSPSAGRHWSKLDKILVRFACCGSKGTRTGSGSG